MLFMASYAFLDGSEDKLLALLTGAADAQLRDLTKGTDGIYKYGLFATAATARQLQGNLTGRKLILCMDNDLACEKRNSLRPCV